MKGILKRQNLSTMLRLFLLVMQLIFWMLYTGAANADQKIWELTETSSTCAGYVPTGNHFTQNPNLWMQGESNAQGYAQCQTNQCSLNVRNCSTARFECKVGDQSSECQAARQCEVNANGIWRSERLTWAAANWKLKAVCSDEAEVNLTDGLCIEPPEPEADKNIGDSCNLDGNPCNVATGNKYMTEEDFSSPAISFRRTYNSLEETDQSDDSQETIKGIDTINIGVGWQTIYEKHLIKSGFYISVVSENGRSEKWFKKDGSWQIIGGSRYSAIEEYDNAFILRYKNGDVERYDLSGKLRSHRDTWRNLTRYYYNNKQQLIRIQKPFGHEITFEHVDGLLDRVNLPNGTSYIDYDYDAIENLVQVTFYADPNDLSKNLIKKYLYEDSNYPHHLTGIIDQTGQRISEYQYDGSGKAVSTGRKGFVNDFNQESLKLSYDSDVQTTVTDSLGNQVVWNFEEILGEKRLINKKFLNENSSYTQQYDARGNLTQKTDENGVITKLTYNSSNQMTSITSAKNTAEERKVQMSYLSPELNFVTKTSTPSTRGTGFKTELFDYDYSGKIALKFSVEKGFNAQGKSESRKTTYRYNKYGQMTKVLGPRLQTDDNVYMSYYDCKDGNECGQLKEVSNAIGQTSFYNIYDSVGRVLQMTDVRGLVHDYQYNPQGWLISENITSPGGVQRLWQYDYDPRGRISETVDPKGAVTSYIYSGDYLIETKDSLNNFIKYNYDKKGNQIKTEAYDPDGSLATRIETIYDSRDRVMAVNNFGSSVSSERDKLGNITREINARSFTKDLKYDPLNRIIEKVDALGNSINYSYDSQDNLTEVITSTGVSFITAYDDFGNIKEETNSDKGVIRYSYDRANNLISKVDDAGKQVNYSYDILNRLIEITYADATENVLYEYDNCTNGTGLLCQITDKAGVTTYSYDEFGNVLATNKEVLDHTTPDTFITEHEYDQTDLVTRTTYPSGLSVNYARDILGRITDVDITIGQNTQTLLAERKYGADGRVYSQKWGNQLNEVRKYEDRGWLTEISVDGVFNHVYSYDVNSNLTQKISNQADVNSGVFGRGSYEYTTATNQLSVFNERSYQYDVLGNLVNDGVFDYQYSTVNRLSSISKNGYAMVEYEYDHAQRRISKRYPSKDQITRYHYDLSDRLIAESDNDNLITKEYIWLGNIPIAQIQQGNITYLVTDHQGTPRVGMNQSQEIVWRWKGEIFGSSFAENDPDKDGKQTEVNLRFLGQYYDIETGYHYNWNRYYDPKTGRYITSDPIGFGGGLNTYAYAGQNPMRFVDPYGLFSLPSVPQSVVDFSAGLGDALLLGFGDDLRGLIGVDGGIDKCSSFYTYGEYASYIGGSTAVVKGAIKYVTRRSAPKGIPGKFTKAGGGSNTSDFITTHSQKHMFDASKASTKNRSQFGENVNVKALTNDTMANPTSAFSDINSRITKYSKSYDFNISTSATPTGEMRVFINNSKPNRSTQFPYVPRGD